MQLSSPADYKVSVEGCTSETDRPTMSNVPEAKFKIWTISKSTKHVKIICNEVLVLDWEVPAIADMEDKKQCAKLDATTFRIWFLKNNDTDVGEMSYTAADYEVR